MMKRTLLGGLVLEALVGLHAAAAAKLLQSCPTLCDPIDGSPPGSTMPLILQARTLEWVAISFYIEPFNFSFFSITGQGIDFDYHDIEWFALEMSRDHSVFEIASKYCLPLALCKVHCFTGLPTLGQFSI